MTLVVRDDRGSTQSAAYAGLGEVWKRDGAVLNTPAGNAVGVGIGLAAVLKAQAAPSRHFKSPNDLHIPVLPLGLHQQLLSARISVDSAGEGKIQATTRF